MGIPPSDKQFPRFTMGVPIIDEWVDCVASALERNANVTGTGGIQANVGPTGISLAFARKEPLVWAKSKSGGITAGGKADVTLQDWDGSAMQSQGVDVEAINMGSDAVGATKLILLALVGKYYFVVWENCS